MDFGCFFGHEWDQWSEPIVKQVEISLIEDKQKNVLALEQVLVKYRTCKRCKALHIDKKWHNL